MALNAAQILRLDALHDHLPELGKHLGVENPNLGTLLSSLESPESGDAATIGIADAGALFAADNVEDALAEVKIKKRTVTVAHDTAAIQASSSNGASVAVNIGDALPANSRIVGCDMRSLTPFTGGGASAVTVDIGTSGDVDAIVDGANVLAAAVDGGPSTMPSGIRPNKMFAAAGAQLIATFIPDGGASLQGLTAGSVVIDVLFVELP